MIPKTKSTEEVFSKILDDKTKGLNEKLDEIASKMAAKPKEEKIEDIIKKMKERTPEKIVKKDQDIVKTNVEKEDVKESVKKESEHVHDDVFCPSCGKGHIHKMESSGLTMKCTDGNCGEKFFVIPEGADHSCSECGYPIKKPADDKLLEACPFCKNTKALPFSSGKPVIKFDFSKMKK